MPLIITWRLVRLRFDLCICAIVCLSSMASVATQGSDSHDAPLLFVLLCESSVRLCLPLSFLSARCLRGKVSLSSLSSTFRPLSLFHSLLNTHWALLSTSFAPLSVVRCLLPPSQRNSSSLTHSSFAPCPCFFLNVKPLPVIIIFLWLSNSELLWSSSYCLRSLTTYL